MRDQKLSLAPHFGPALSLPRPHPWSSLSSSLPPLLFPAPLSVRFCASPRPPRPIHPPFLAAHQKEEEHAGEKGENQQPHDAGVLDRHGDKGGPRVCGRRKRAGAASDPRARASRAAKPGMATTSVGRRGATRKEPDALRPSLGARARGGTRERAGREGRLPQRRPLPLPPPAPPSRTPASAHKSDRLSGRLSLRSPRGGRILDRESRAGGRDVCPPRGAMAEPRFDDAQSKGLYDAFAQTLSFSPVRAPPLPRRRGRDRAAL